MVDLFPGYVNGMKGKTSKITGCIKIYNPELNIIKYIKKEDSIENYPGFVLGDRPRQLRNLNYTKNPIYMNQLRQRFKGKRFIYNNDLRICKRVDKEDIDKYLKDG